MISIHTGKIGEIAVQKDLLLQEYNIYLPVVDSGIDLIVELPSGSMQRVQVKCVTEMKKRTSIEVNLTKYKNTKKIDVVAVYFAPKDIIAYVPYENTHHLTLAISTGKNNQIKHRKWFYSYASFPEFS
jgi:hypothetical protein